MNEWNEPYQQFVVYIRGEHVQEIRRYLNRLRNIEVTIEPDEPGVEDLIRKLFIEVLTSIKNHDIQ